MKKELLEENYIKLCESFIKSLEAQVINKKDATLDDSIVHSSKRSWSTREMIDGIRNNDTEALYFVDNTITLALDIFQRNKENLKDFKIAE